MKFEYPNKEINDQNASKRVGSSNSFGYYPISRFNAWHGGFHLEGAGKEIRAIADGKVIAYRFPKDYTEETIGTEKSYYSNGFVLIRHEYKSPNGQNLIFFSLYMHLLPKLYMMGSKRKTPVIFTGKTGDVNGINVRRAVDRSVAFVIPKGVIVDLDPDPVPAGHWSKSATDLPNKFRKITYKDSNNTVWTEIFIATTDSFVEDQGGGKLKIKAEKATGPCPECYSFNIKDDKFDKVINCSIPVKAGDMVGYTGLYGFEKKPDYTAAHVEVFTHEDVTSFLVNLKKDGEKENEKNYFKVKKGAVLKRAYPGKIPGEGTIKVLQQDGNYACVQPFSSVKTVAFEDITWHAAAAGQTEGHYTIKGGEPFNRVNLAFGNLLAKEAKLEKIEITGNYRKVSHQFPATVKSYWTAASGLPAGTTDIRDLAADITEVYEQKPDPARLQDTAEEEHVVAKKACRKVTGTDGKAWYYIKLEDESKEGWMKEGTDLISVSAYNWTDFGFVKIEDQEDQYLYDPKQPPAFLSSIWSKIDTGNKVLTSQELRNAFNNPLIAKKLSKLVCKHTTEWAWGEKWDSYKSKILELYQEGIDEEQDGELKRKLETRRDETINALKERLKALCFWQEVKPVPPEEKKPDDSSWSFTSFAEVWDRMFGEEPKAVPPQPSPSVAPVLFPPSPKVFHFHPIAFVEQMRRLRCPYCSEDITDTILKTISTATKKEKIEEFLSGFNQTFKEFKISTCLRRAHFFAQVFHESGSLKFTKEGNGEEASYAPFYGRGLIQLTLEENYKKYSEKVGEDCYSNETNRKKLEQNPHAVKSAGFFWDNNNLNNIADKNDLLKATVVVNGGLNGYEDRLEFLKNGFEAFEIEKCTSCEGVKDTFKFEESAIYNSAKSAFAWGYWNDPDLSDVSSIRLFKTRNKSESIKGYNRFIELAGENFNHTNWYKVQKQTILSSLKEDGEINVKKAAEKRLEDLQ